MRNLTRRVKFLAAEGLMSVTCHWLKNTMSTERYLEYVKIAVEMLDDCPLRQRLVEFIDSPSKEMLYDAIEEYQYDLGIDIDFPLSDDE